MNFAHKKNIKMMLRTIFTVLIIFSGSLAAASKTQIDYEEMYSKCIDASGGINNGTVDACSSYTSDQVKKEMNRLYKKIYESFLTDFPEDAKKLEQAQQAWITYRNGQCSLAASHVGSPMYSYCPMKLNIARVIELRELAGE
jgi:uncharacterized protein YecT (DUF1311 family)